jgi:chromosome segregation and condensation protein ScpB
MKLLAYHDPVRETELIASFGENSDTQLVRHLNGRYEVRAASAAGLAEARLWCSIFCKGRPITWPPDAT